MSDLTKKERIARLERIVSYLLNRVELLEDVLDELGDIVGDERYACKSQQQAVEKLGAAWDKETRNLRDQHEQAHSENYDFLVEDQ